jgi:hypothetical protein
MFRDGNHSTSTQVEREWNRIVYTVCVALRNALAASDDWTDVVKKLSLGYGRTAARAMQVTHWITGSDTTDFEIVSKRLEDFQRIRFRVMFHAGIGTVRDGTNCDVARRRPRLTSSGWEYNPQCRKTDDICDQPAFLAACRQRAERAALALQASKRKADRKMGEGAITALQSPSVGATKGKACHADRGLGGDIIIALECAEDETLVTTDESFDFICPAIGIKHVRL